MKKLLFAAFAAALALLSSCDLKNHFSFDNLEFDYPAGWTVNHQDTDGDLFSIMISKSNEDFGFIFIEILREDTNFDGPDVDPEILGEYLKETAHEIGSLLLPDDSITFTDPLPDAEDLFLDIQEGGHMEALGYAEGKYDGQPFYSLVRTTTHANYRITCYIQADSEDAVNEYLEKVLFTIHDKK